MRIRLLCVASIVLTLPAVTAAQVTVLRPVPRTIVDPARQTLSSDYERMTSSRNGVLQAAADLKRECAGVPDNSPRRGPCSEQQQRVDGQRLKFNAAADAYNDRVVSSLDARIAELRQDVRGDQQAIRNLGIFQNARQFDALGTEAAAANRERVAQVDAALRDAGSAFSSFAIQTAITRGLQTRAAMNAINQFRPSDANRLIRGLNDAGIDAPDIANALRAFARSSGKEKAAAATELLNRLRRAKAIWSLSDISAGEESAKWKAGYQVISALGVYDPKMALIGKLTLAEVRATFYIVNENIELRVINAQIDRMTSLTDQQLLNLKRLSTRLHDNVALLNAAKAERAAIT